MNRALVGADAGSGLGAEPDPAAGSGRHGLLVRRWADANATPSVEPGLLGGLIYGLASAESDFADVGLGVLHADFSQTPKPVDAWCSAGPFTEGQCGAVRWRHNGHWLWGVADLPDAPGELLAATVQSAYGDVFATLRQTGVAHLQRLWNYVPHIHDLDAGQERYRHFNRGRQQAFLAAGQAAFDGAPAACALGTPGGLLRLRFLAGRQAPVALENPRQVSAYRYPASYGPSSPTFSRAALVKASAGQVLLLISGTASITGHASQHVGDLPAQIDETLTNLQALLDTAHTRCTARFTLAALRCTAYLRHAEQAPVLRAHLARRLGADSPALQQLILLQAEVCRPDLLVEIEAYALAAGDLT